MITKERDPSALRVHAVVMQILEFVSEEDLHDLIYWRTDGEYSPITFWVNSNDVLAWGCSDGEEVNEETLPVLKKAVKDCKAIDPMRAAMVGCDLFACRMNKLRPQGAAYPANRDLWPLFDACGPEREVGLGNPYRPGEYKPAAM